MQQTTPLRKYVGLLTALCASLVIALLCSCRTSGIDYARALFEHVPEDPEVLVVVRPDDLIKQFDLLAADADISHWMKQLSIDAGDIERYRQMSLKILEQTGVPVEKLECIGFLSYLKQPVFLISGVFRKEDVERKLKELGFRQDDAGFFDYIYGEQKLHVARDGLIALGREDMLDDLENLPAEHRLWNRADFKKYRETSPLDNSVFVWSHPPESLLKGIPNRETLGNCSLAINFRSGVSLRATVRLKEPDKVAIVHATALAATVAGKKLLGDDPDLGPIVQGIVLSQDNEAVMLNMVISPEQLSQLKERIKREAEGGSHTTLGKLGDLVGIFK